MSKANKYTLKIAKESEKFLNKMFGEFKSMAEWEEYAVDLRKTLEDKVNRSINDMNVYNLDNNDDKLMFIKLKTLDKILEIYVSSKCLEFYSKYFRSVK